MRQQITLSGLIFTGATALVGLAAFASANNLLFLLLAALLATMLISGFVSRLGLAGLELHVQVPEHVAARRPVHGRLVVRNRKLLSPSFSVELSGSKESGLRDTLYFPMLPARTALEASVELLFERRGIHKDNTFYFGSRFPFGFTGRRASVRLEREVLVYPAIDGRPEFDEVFADISGQLEARQQGRGSEFYRIRPYEFLESARHVDWKASARTGELQVREFAREHEQAVTVFFDLDGHVTAEWFESAVECCAYLVWRLHDRGTPLRVITQRFDKRIPEESGVYDVLRYLALVEPLLGAKLPHPDDKNLSLAVTHRLDEAAGAGWMAVDPGAAAMDRNRADPA